MKLLLLPLFCLLSPAFGPVSAQDKRPVDVVTVAEGADALLPCALSSGLSVDQFDWSKDSEGEEKEEVFFYDKGSYYGHGRSEQYQSQQFRGRVVFLNERLESGDASITIQKTRLEDNGTYTCVLFKPQRHEVKVRLNVGAAPLPHIYQIPENNKILLECKAHGVPKPELEWRDSSGTAFPAENGHLVEHGDTSGHFHVALRVYVTRSDNYTCVVTQKDIYHQIKNALVVIFQDFVAVSEEDVAVLPCSRYPKENIESMEFFWSKEDKEVFLYKRGSVEEGEHLNGRLKHFPSDLISGNASIKILNAQISDSGQYTCHFPSLQKSVIILKVVGKKHDTEDHTKWVVPTVIVVIVTIVTIGAITLGVFIRRLSKKGQTAVPSDISDNFIKGDSH